MEDDGTISITLTLSEVTNGPIQVVTNTMDVTATGMFIASGYYKPGWSKYLFMYCVDPGDYAGGTRTITIAAGTTTESFTISIADNNVVECSESFVVSIGSVNGDGVTVGNVNSTEVTITDDDG